MQPKTFSLFARLPSRLALLAPAALVLVGALFVGSISTVWHGDITPRSQRRRVELPLDTDRAALRLSKGSEMGRFNMGSTVILLLPNGVAQWLPKFKAGSQVEVGRMLARLPEADSIAGEARFTKGAAE